MTVDEKGTVLAGVKVWAADQGPGVTSGPDGSFVLVLKGGSLVYTTVLAATANYELMSMTSLSYTNEVALPPMTKITAVLKPCSIQHIRVSDKSNRPVEGAKVALSAIDAVVAAGETDEQGGCTLRFPSDAIINYVIGYKSGSGLDYLDNSRTRAWRDAKPLPDEVKLVLNGAQTVKVRATDSSGKPVVGVPICPWFIGKVGRGTEANPAGKIGWTRITNAEGIATFDYLPKDVSSHVQFEVSDPNDWHCLDPVVWSTEVQSTPVQEARLLKNVSVRGLVIFPDGQPAGGVLLQAEGRGNTNDYCRIRARTRLDGSFEFRLYAEQTYMIAVTDPDWAAPSIKGMAIHESSDHDNLVFQLSKGTLLTGVLRTGPKGQPLANQTITVVEQGNPISYDQLGGKVGAGDDTPEELVRWTQTDSEGRYSMRLGKGSYQITLDHQRCVNVEITDQKEVTPDFGAAR